MTPGISLEPAAPRAPLIPTNANARSPCFPTPLRSTRTKEYVENAGETEREAVGVAPKRRRTNGLAGRGDDRRGPPRWRSELLRRRDAQLVVLRFGPPERQLGRLEGCEELHRPEPARDACLTLDAEGEVLAPRPRVGEDLSIRLVRLMKLEASGRTMTTAKFKESFGQDRRGSCLILAILAASTFHVARAWDNDQLWKYVADAATTVAGAAALFWIGRRDAPAARRLPPNLAAAFGGFLVLPVILEVVLRSLIAQGDAVEVVMLICLRNAALGTAAFAQRRSQARGSCIFSGFLTLFAVSISDGRAVYVPASMFAAVGLWSLMGVYWDRLQAKSAVESRRQLPLKVGVLGAVCAVLTAAEAASWPELGTNSSRCRASCRRQAANTARTRTPGRGSATATCWRPPRSKR